MNHRFAATSNVALWILSAGLLSAPAHAELRFEVSSDQKTFYPGDRITLKARLINEGDQPVAIYWKDGRFRDQVIVEVVRADGRRLTPRGRYDLPPLGALEPKYLRQIPAGESMDLPLRVGGSFDSLLSIYGRHIIRLPGKYTVHGSFAIHPDTPPDVDAPCWTGRLDAEPVEIELSTDLPPEKEARIDRSSSNLGTTMIRGRIVDQNGEPVADKIVSVSRRRWVSGGGGRGLRERMIARTRSDTAGRIEFEQLPDDCAFFILSCFGLDGKTTRSLVQADPPERQLWALISLQPPAPQEQPMTIRGFVRDSRGGAIEGVKVRAYDCLDEEHYTDDEGRFELKTVPHKGKIRLFTNRSGYVYRERIIPVEMAEAEPLTLVIKAEDEMTARGRIRFRSGRATKGLNARFKLKDEQGAHAGARSFGAADDGRFEVILRREGILSGNARLSFGRLNSYDAQPRWWAEVHGLAPGVDDAEIEINDTGSIEVEVQTIEAPQAIGPISVRLEPLGDQHKPIDVQEVGSEGGRISFVGLCPGDYRVEVRVALYDYWSWSKKLSLAEDGGRLHETVSFPLPRLGFGSVRGRVVGEDGKIPDILDRAEVRPSAGRRAGPALRYDAAGTFSADKVLSGRFWLTISAEGYEAKGIPGVIEPGKTIDLGQITLKLKSAPEHEDGYGIATGRLLYDDATPVLGPHPSGWSHVAITDADGTFRRKISAGQRVVEFRLTTTRIWPGAHVAHKHLAGSSLPHRVRGPNWGGARGDYGLVADFTIRPDETTSRDLVIPNRNLAAIRFDWLGEEKAHLRIGCFSTAGGLQFQRRGAFYPKGGFTIEIPDVRPGERVVTVRAEDLFGYKRFGPEEIDLNAVFGPTLCGSIEGRVLRSDGAPNVHARVFACPGELEVRGGIRSTTGQMLPFVDDRDRPWPALAAVRTDSNGRFGFSKVSPGQYVLYVDKESEAIVEVSVGKRAAAHLISDRMESVSGNPPLRKADDE